MLKLISPELLLPGVELPLIELPTEDGIPLETNWHRMQMNLLIESVHYHWREREDYFTGGNMFIYFSVEQVRNRDYRGPDFFVVKGVDSSHDRAAWIACNRLCNLGFHLSTSLNQIRSPDSLTEPLPELRLQAAHGQIAPIFGAVIVESTSTNLAPR